MLMGEYSHLPFGTPSVYIHETDFKPQECKPVVTQEPHKETGVSNLGWEEGQARSEREAIRSMGEDGLLHRGRGERQKMAQSRLWEGLE